MKYLIDENFPKKGIPLLIESGNSAIDIRGTELEGISDLQIFEIAQKEKAVLLTTDKDFFHTIHFTNKPHHGIIVIALSQPSSEKIISKLEWFLNSFNDIILNDKCYLISNNNCKIFS